MKKLFKRMFLASALLLTTIGSSIGSINASWNTSEGGATTNDNANATSQNYPNVSSKDAVCINEKTGVVYTSLIKAIAVANSAASSSNAQTVTVLIGKTITVDSQNITLNPYVTLKLPFVLENGNYICDNTDTSKISSYGGGRISQLNMRNGYDIIVSSNASLNVGGTFTTTGNNGKYCEINLGVNSHIEVSGTLNCYGFIRENSSDAVGFFDDERENVSNSNDSGRYIEIKSGATLNTFMNIRDAMSGSPLGTVLQSHKLCPFNIWDFNALQTFTKINYNARLNADAVMTISSNIVRKQAGIVGTSNSMLLLSNGASVCFEYCPKTPGTLNNNRGQHYTNVVMNGSISLGTLYIDAGSGGMYLDTSQCFMPFSYNFNVYANNGSTITLGHQVKFLPGAYLKICSGGEIVLTSDLIVYQEAQCPDSWTYPSGCGDATFIVDGTFTCTGNIGALIETTSSVEDGASLDFSGVNADSHFSATAVETVTYTEVKVDTKGKFLFDGEISESTFSIQETYMSGDPSIGYYWKGNTVSAYEIIVTIASNSYAHPISSYVLSSSDTASGTKSEIVSTSNAYSTTIPVGKYLTIDWNRAAGATITNGAGTVDTSSGSSVTFLPTGRVNIIITPNEGVAVDTAYGKNYWQTEYTSGAAAGVTTIKECKTSGGSYYTVAELSGGAQTGTTYVVKGRYFKVTVVEGTGLSSIEHKYVWRPENYDNKWTTTGRETHNESTAYNATGNYAFYWEWKVKSSSGCLLPDSLVTMADGTQKAVKYVEQGDMVKVFNHETGEIDVAPITFNDYDATALMIVMNLRFSNGKSVGVISEHGFFDLDTMRYEYITEENYSDFIGHRFYTEEGGEAVLSSVDVREEITECYSPTSFFHFDYFVNGMLSMPGGITGLFNIFDYADNLQYDQEKMAEDIATYGLFTYEDLAPLGVTEIMFEAYAGKYLKVALGKGILTEEYLMYLIERYGGFTE